MKDNIMEEYDTYEANGASVEIKSIRLSNLAGVGDTELDVDAELTMVTHEDYRITLLGVLRDPQTHLPFAGYYYSGFPFYALTVKDVIDRIKRCVFPLDSNCRINMGKFISYIVNGYPREVEREPLRPYGYPISWTPPYGAFRRLVLSMLEADFTAVDLYDPPFWYTPATSMKVIDMVEDADFGYSLLVGVIPPGIFTYSGRGVVAKLNGDLLGVVGAPRVYVALDPEPVLRSEPLQNAVAEIINSRLREWSPKSLEGSNYYVLRAWRRPSAEPEAIEEALRLAEALKGAADELAERISGSGHLSKSA